MPPTPDELERDQHLRRSILEQAKAGLHRSDGFVSLPRIMRTLSRSMHAADCFQSPEHAVQLARELAGKGLLEERIVGERRYQQITHENLEYKLSPRGTSLLNESIPPDPDVEDERPIR